MGQSKLALIGFIAATITTATAAGAPTNVMGVFNFTRAEQTIFSNPRASQNFSMPNNVNLQVSVAGWQPSSDDSADGTVNTAAVFKLIGPGTPGVTDGVLARVCIRQISIRSADVLDEGRTDDGDCGFIGEDCAQDLMAQGGCGNGELPDGRVTTRCNFGFSASSMSKSLLPSHSSLITPYITY
jgi:hypothetical protein